MLYLKCKKKFRKDQIVTGNLLQYTGTPCPRTVTGFCRCFAFRIGKIHYHHCIVRNFQFRKFLPVYSNCKPTRYSIGCDFRVHTIKRPPIASSAVGDLFVQSYLKF